ISVSGRSVFLAGSLSANGTGTGSGGIITVSAQTASPILIDQAVTDLLGTESGIAGTLSAEAPGTSGAGGHIAVGNSGNGGIVLASTDSISVTAGGGDGGSIELSSTGGLVRVAAGRLSANAVGDGNGGTISIQALGFVIGSGTDINNPEPLDLSANAAGTGNGGIISVVTTAPNQPLITVGSGQLTLSATGGSAGSGAGKGDRFNRSAGKDLTLDPSLFVVRPLETNGDGAILNHTASNAPTSPKTEGILSISGSMNVDGVGEGAGGKVNLKVNSATTFA